MHNLTLEQKQQIAERIRQIETQTLGELVTVIARRSDDYFYIPSLWAALLALLTPLATQFFWLQLTINQLVLLQLGCFTVLVLLFRWPPLTLLLVPKTIQHTRCQRRAQELFFMEGLHLTQGRTAVMLFVSEAEKYVEILADAGIDAEVADEQWDALVDNFVSHVKAGQVAQGFLETIDGCGQLLIKHFPVTDSRVNPNELSDHLIEID